jgi:hypothetical protein
MNLKKLALSTIVGSVVMLVLGGLWHGVIMAKMFSPMPVLQLVAVAYVILALLMSYAYPIGYKGGSAVKEGLRFGAFFGLVWILPLQLIFYASGQLTINFVITEALWHVVEQGVGGIAIALTYSKLK